MRLLDLYFGVHGRVSRRTWWFGAIGLALAFQVLRLPLMQLLRYERQVAAPENDLVSLSWVTDESHLQFIVANTLLAAVACVMGYCLSIKRRHDRNASGWDVGVLFAVPVAFGLLKIGSLLLPLGDQAPVGPDGFAVTLFVFAGYVYQPFALYVIVVLGLLKGTNGANRFGPDPLVAPAPPVTEESS